MLRILLHVKINLQQICSDMEKNFFKYCGGFYNCKCHLDGMFPISVSGFISNTGDEDLNLCRLQKLVHHIYPVNNFVSHQSVRNRSGSD